MDKYEDQAHYRREQLKKSQEVNPDNDNQEAKKDTRAFSDNHKIQKDKEFKSNKDKKATKAYQSDTPLKPEGRSNKDEEE